jgi:nucleoside-diphosphate-sugar epimerase
MLADLIARDFEVHAVSRTPQDKSENIVWHACDLLDTTATEHMLATVGATHLMHLAWVTEPGVYWQSPQNTEWLASSLALLKSFEKHGGQRALLAGTCAEYDWSDGHCVENVTPLRAKSLYAESKLAFREAAFEAAAKSPLEIVWARVFFSFGPYERPERLVPAVINALLAGERAKCGDGSLIRDFLYVPDVAAAMVAALDSAFDGDVNIASGQAQTLEQLVERIANKLAVNDRIDFGYYPNRPDDPQKITADVSRLRDTIGWSPEYDLDSAIDESIAWWRTQAV